MAIRINASSGTTYLTRDGSANPITTSIDTDWGFCGWVYRDVDIGGTYEYVFQFSTGVTDDGGIDVRIKNDDLGVNPVGGGDYSLGGTLATGGWRFFAWAASDVNTGNRYYGTTTTLTAAAEPLGIAGQLDAVIIGTYPSGAPLVCLNGRIAHLRIWSGYAPSQSNFELEMVSTTAVHTGSLWAAYEFANGALTTDSSGHGYTLTQTGSDASYVAGPVSGQSTVPVKMNQYRQRR